MALAVSQWPTAGNMASQKVGERNDKSLDTQSKTRL